MCCEHPWGFRVGSKPGHVLKSNPEVFCERFSGINPVCREQMPIKNGNRVITSTLALPGQGPSLVAGGGPADAVAGGWVAWGLVRGRSC